MKGIKGRRSVLAAGAVLSASVLGKRLLAAPGAGGKSPFRYSICNEVFEKRDFAETCRLSRQLGYTGFEIAPFTLADSVDDISPARRRELRDIMKSEGIEFAGLHWLLITPKWLHITTSDKSIRERSWEYFGKLIDFCGDLGSPSIMVLGSPKQRGTKGNTREEATRLLTDGLAKVAPRAGARKVTICLEALDHNQTDVINTVDEAVAVVKKVKHPAIQTMFDYHNTLDEKQPVAETVRRHFKMVRHIHINEMDGRHPGTGSYDFLPVLKVLKEKKYKGWVSLEVFDFKLGAERIGREAMEHIRGL